MDNGPLISKLINASFPKLKNKKIKILGFKIFSGYAVFIPILNLICVNKKCENFSDREKIGLLVHELCHAEQSNKERFLKNISWFVAYWLSKKIRKKTEVQTDKLAIKKGYGKELFEITKIFEKEFGKTRYGLSQIQIKSYAKKIGK